MKRKHCFVGAAMLLQLLSHQLTAQSPQPKGSAIVTPADCQANGKIAVHMTAQTGTAYFALIAPSAQLRSITIDSVFENLPPGNYTVAIYDDATGTDVNSTSTHPTIIPNLVVASTYQPMKVIGVSTGVDDNNIADCKSDHGRIDISFTGGKAPFVCTLAAAQRPDSVVNIGTTIGTGLVRFTSVRADDYIATIRDSCGNTITATASVTIDNNLGNFVFNAGASYWGGIYSFMQTLHCDTLVIAAVSYYFGVPNNGAWVAGTNAITGKQEWIIGNVLQIRFEYPQGSGNYTAWYKTDGSTNVKVPGYHAVDPKTLHIQVRNPCTGQTIDLPSVTPPPLDFYVVNTQTGDVCNAAPTFVIQPTAPYYWSTIIPGSIFPVTIDVTERGAANPGTRYVWDSANSLMSGGVYYFKGTPLQYGKTYDVRIVNGCGDIWQKSLSIPSVPPPIFLLTTGGSCSLDSLYIFPVWNTGINTAGHPVKATILSGPGTMAGTTKQVTRLPQTNYDFSFLAPYGAYKIRYDFLDSTGTVCYSEIDSISTVQTYKYYKTDTVLVTTGSSCGLYNLELQGYIHYVDSARSYGSNFVGYLYDSTDRLVAVAGTTNDNKLFSHDIPAGNYRWVVYMSQYCLDHPLDTTEVRLPGYQLPVVDVAASGGVICPETDTGTLRVQATGISLPLTYSIRNDSLHVNSGEDSTGIFHGLPAGDYHVRVKDACGNAVTQTLTLFTATALQQLKLSGVNADGSVCEKNTLTISTVPVGAIDSIRWQLPNHTSVRGNTSYTVAAFSLQDTGIYSSTIYANGCVVEAQTPFISFAPQPRFSVRSIAVCVGNGLAPDSTVYTPDNNAYTMAWYADSFHLHPLPASVYPLTDSVYYFNIVSKQGCSKDSSISVRVYPKPSIGNITGDTTLCIGDTGKLASTTVGGIWQSIDSLIAGVDQTGKILTLQAGSVAIRYGIQDSHRCSSDTQTIIRVWPLPVLDTVITNGHCGSPGIINLHAQNGAAPYLFSIDGGGSFIPDSIFNIPIGNYRVSARDAKGCLSSNYSITIIDDCSAPDIQIPNIITPTGDGLNDTWKITGLRPGDVLQVKIVNRWGNLVYENNNYDHRWSGEGLNAGTYYYLLTIRTTGNKQYYFKGTILIVR